ncbi:MAG: hypothetical protein KGM98_09775 [Bacteroidota bacterium]|nr:hypothetical protein [Bacteroidota bacterium]
MKKYSRERAKKLSVKSINPSLFKHLKVLVMKKNLCFALLLLTLIPFTGCQAQQKKGDLTQEIVEQTIQNSLYPLSNNSDVSVTTLTFHSVAIASPHIEDAHDDDGLTIGTKFYPVLVSFTSSNKTQYSPADQPLMETHDIVQKYLFYKDEFGKWSLDMVSSSENRDVDKRFLGPKP